MPHSPVYQLALVFAYATTQKSHGVDNEHDLQALDSVRQRFIAFKRKL